MRYELNYMNSIHKKAVAQRTKARKETSNKVRLEFV